MAYIYDADLEFLKSCSDEELGNLFDILVYDKDGETRFTESLTTSEDYKNFGRKYSKYWKTIAGELQQFGGNTVVNLVRRNGVKYDEILNDVLDSLKIKYDKNSDIVERENKLILFCFEKMLEGMTDEEKFKLAKEMNLEIIDFKTQTMIATVQTAFRMGGFFSYQIAVIVANYVSKMLLGRGLTLAGNAMLTKGLSVFMGPIGWAVTGAWTVVDIASPAKRVTIPAAVIVACLRKSKIEG